MNKGIHPLLLWSLFTAALVAFLHISALNFYLYYFLPWIDTPIHFLGGLLIGLISAYVISLFNAFSKWRPFFLFSVIIWATLVVGILWEIFEFMLGIAGAANYFLDTSIDLLADLIGGTVALAVFKVQSIHEGAENIES